MAKPHYNERGYREFLAVLAERPQSCWICGRGGATSVDHVPALVLHEHLAGSGCCELRAAHKACNLSAGASLGNALRADVPVERVSAAPSGRW